MTLDKAQKICMELDAVRQGGVVSVKWNEIYPTEAELIEALREVDIPSNKVAPNYTFKGYEYIFSFAKRLQEGRELTEAQLRQAKRLALEIKKANAISEYMREV